MNDKIREEILNYNYWEHFKAAKELSLVVNIDNYKRKEIEKSMNEILKELNNESNLHI